MVSVLVVVGVGCGGVVLWVMASCDVAVVLSGVAGCCCVFMLWSGKRGILVVNVVMGGGRGGRSFGGLPFRRGCGSGSDVGGRATEGGWDGLRAWIVLRAGEGVCRSLVSWEWGSEAPACRGREGCTML